MPEPTTPLDLERLRKLTEAATPGPWSADPTGTVCADADLVLDVNGGLILPEGGPMEVAECYRNERPDWTERAANAEFIAAARTAVPALLAALSEARQPHDDRFLAVLKTDWEEAQQKVAALSIVEENFREADAAIERVRALHSPVPGWEREWKDPAEALREGWPSCAGCATHVTFTPIGKCRTLAALDGTGNPGGTDGS